MKIKHTRPRPLIAFLRLFGMRPGPTAIFTWGTTVFSPGPLTVDLLAHEERHSIQQKGFLGPLRWWIRYARDPEFRFEQEAQACGAQFRCQSERMPGRIALRSLYGLVDLLCSPMYAIGCDQKRARERIQDWARFPEGGQSSKARVTV